ncbi:MAG: DUF4139 domain-containing protein, partial [Candidatus Hydrogenedentes bacterium]|nr:DUF4139 domain-containing protein [Candidatus Hydrogenedentota bacterium]
DPLKESGVASETTLADQQDVAVTVYNNNLALVRDTRAIKMMPGEQELRFADVATGIKPETVSLKSTSAPGTLHILEQNYEFDLISPSKLMEKYVGKQVSLVNFSNEIITGREEAELLSVNEGPVYKVGNEIYLGYPGQVVLPEIPENFVARPSLIWLLQNDGTDHTVEVTYLTNGLSWQADYVVTLAQDETMLDLEGWVTLNNQSGAAYTNAQLKLVAGDVNIVQPEVMERELMAKGVSRRGRAMPEMVQETFAEYHLYSLPRRTTIKQNQSKQVSLLTATGVAVKKEYEYRGNESFYSQKLAPMKEEKVSAFLKFDNKEANQLGVPLPSGVMRVYQEDSEKMLQFSGEDRIKHTPKDEEVRLRLGNAFDIVGERTQTDYQVIADNVFESAYEIKIRNHKETPVSVDIVEPMPGDWEIREKSQDFVKKDARTAVFTVEVPKDGEAIVTYRVMVSYGTPLPMVKTLRAPAMAPAPNAPAASAPAIGIAPAPSAPRAPRVQPRPAQ